MRSLTGAGMSPNRAFLISRSNGIRTKNPKAEQQAYESYFKFQQTQTILDRALDTGTSWINELAKAQPNRGICPG